MKYDKKARQQFPIGSSQIVEEHALMYQVSGQVIKRKAVEGSS